LCWDDPWWVIVKRKPCASSDIKISKSNEMQGGYFYVQLKICRLWRLSIRSFLIWFHYYNTGKLPGQHRKGSFWWRDIVKLLEKFKSMSSVIVAEGSSVIFWKTNGMGSL
jgi:hypothetical protein